MGKGLAPVMGELVARLRRFGELDVSDEGGRRTDGDVRGHDGPATGSGQGWADVAWPHHTKPGSLLKDAIAIRTWAQWDDVVPSFVEIDLVAHEGGNAIGEHAYTPLPITPQCSVTHDAV